MGQRLITCGYSISHTWISAQNLRSLDTDSFLALGQLPYLGSLEIRRVTDYYTTKGTPERLPSSVRGTILSENAFPSLRRIATYDVHSDDILLLWTLSPIVKHLSQLELMIPLTTSRFSRDDRTKLERFLESFLPVLCAESPQLTGLTINCNPIKSSKLGVLNLDTGYFACLVSLPLQRVELVGVHLSHADMEDDITFPRLVTTLWPAVVHLKVSDQSVSLNELHYFAMLPNLRYLLLNCWDVWSTADTISFPSKDHPLHTLEFGKPLNMEFKSVSMNVFAKYVLPR